MKVKLSILSFLLHMNIKKIIGFNDTNDLVEDPSEVVDQHVDDFIHVRRHIWEVVCFNFDKYPIYDVEGSSKKRG
jgi:hypothetical protein